MAWPTPEKTCGNCPAIWKDPLAVKKSRKPSRHASCVCRGNITLPISANTQHSLLPGNAAGTTDLKPAAIKIFTAAQPVRDGEACRSRGSQIIGRIHPKLNSGKEPFKRGMERAESGKRLSSWTAVASAARHRFRTHENLPQQFVSGPPESAVAAPALPAQSKIVQTIKNFTAAQPVCRVFACQPAAV